MERTREMERTTNNENARSLAGQASRVFRRFVIPFSGFLADLIIHHARLQRWGA